MVFVRFPTAILLLSACSLISSGFAATDFSTSDSGATKTKNSILRGGFHGGRRLAGHGGASSIASASGPNTEVDLLDDSATTDKKEATGNDWDSFMSADGHQDNIPGEARALNDNPFVRRASNTGTTATNTVAASGDNVFQHDTAQRTGDVYKSSKGGYPGPYPAYPPSPTPQWPQWPQWPGPYPPTPTGGSGHRPHYNPRPPRRR